MAFSHSPSIVTNGLTFYLDMSNVKKSWKGKPITNQYPLPTPDANGNVTFPVNGTGTFKRVLTGKYGGYEIQPTDVVYRYDLSSTGGCHYHGGSAAISAGQYATFTFDYYVSQDAANYPSTNYLANFENYGGTALGGGVAAPNNTRGIWQTVTFTAGPSSSGGTQAMFLYPGSCGGDLATSGYILYKNPQVIFSSTSNDTAPYTSGTRSTTGAVIDMVGKNTLTSNLTYNTDNTFSFSGSQYIDISNSSLISGNNPFTIESWTNLTSGSYGEILGNYGSGYSSGLWWSTAGLYIGGSVYHTNYATTMAGKHHSAVTRDSTGNVTLYRDGVQVATGTLTGSIPTNINWRIGSDVNVVSESMNGNIYNVKVYNRVLTATEIAQNFTAQRSRYGI